MKNIANFRQHYYALTYKCFNDFFLLLFSCIVMHTFIFFSSFSIWISLYRRLFNYIYWKLINQQQNHYLDYVNFTLWSHTTNMGRIGTWTLKIFLTFLLLHLPFHLYFGLSLQISSDTKVRARSHRQTSKAQNQSDTATRLLARQLLLAWTNKFLVENSD